MNNDEVEPLNAQSLLDDIIAGDATLVNDLASIATNDYRQARDHQISSGTYDNLMLSMRAAARQYSREEKASLPDGVELYVGLTASKIRAGKAWIGDLLANSQDRPFTLKPTPIPALPSDIKKAIVSLLEAEIAEQQIAQDQVDSDAKIRQLAKSFKVLGMRHAERMAAEAMEKMETLIADQMVEGNWRDAMRSLVSDVLTFPYGVMEGPTFCMKPKLHWDGNDFVESTRLTMNFNRVSPFDAYPSSDSRDCQTGEYFIVVSHSTPSQLYDMIGTDAAVRDDEVRAAIMRYGTSGYRLEIDSERDYLDGTSDNLTDQITIDVIRRYGRIAGSALVDYIDVPDPAKYYETIIYVVGEFVLYAAINNYPLSYRPIYSTSYQKIPDSFAGEGLGQILDDPQRITNAAWRAIAINMAFLGEPIGEYDLERIEEGSDPTQLTPGTMFPVNTDVGAQQGSAIRLMKIPNSINELLAVRAQTQILADELSGIPPYVMGGTPAGGVGRTLGGLTAMLGNAAKGIKDVIGNIEMDITEPAVTLMYNYNMLTNPDRSIKADAQVMARASQGIMQREMAQTRSLEALQTVMPFFSQGIIEPPGMQVLIREVLAGMGQPVDKILPDPLRKAEIARTIGSSAVTSAPATPGPALDGRSLKQMPPA